MTPEDLAEVAQWLADDSRTGRAKQAYRRRAVSTSYYALLHALARLCADELVGPGPEAEREHVYRALDHTGARNGLQALATETGDPALKRIATIFRDLQSARHDADYKESQTFSAPEAMRWRDTAAKAISDLSTLQAGARRSVAIRLLFKARSNRR